MTEKDYRYYFDKIQFFGLISDDLVSYAAQLFGQEYFDFVDLNCGSMPIGQYEDLIDQAAPMEFLNLYAGIILQRIEITLLKILKAGDDFKPLLEKYFENESQKIEAGSPDSLSQAYAIVNGFTLDSYMNEDVITENNENQIKWHKETTICPLIYTLALPSFFAGVFRDTDFQLSVSADTMEFCLTYKEHNL